MYPFLIAIAIVISAACAVRFAMRRRNVDIWIGGYIRPEHRPVTPDPSDNTRHVFIAICDHFEPECGRATQETGRERVRQWIDEYPQLFSEFHDERGRVPQHTFFFPQDEYRPEYLDQLGKLCEDGFGDVDVHLHHDNDTASGLRDKLESFRDDLFHRHGLLRRDPQTGEIVYGFIHGNWALCNSRPDGRWCGVNEEINILQQTGCYADFTMPSAPSNTQTKTINSIYYAFDQPGRPKSHETGQRARAGRPAPDGGLLMIQGPLTLDWRRRKFGVLPRIENGDVHAGLAPTWNRMQQWLNCHVSVQGRDDWLFVKLHTHGCKPRNLEEFLSESTQRFHRQLAEQSRANPNFKYYYVTAWEMAQLVHQAEQGAMHPDFPSPITSHAPAQSATTSE